MRNSVTPLKLFCVAVLAAVLAWFFLGVSLSRPMEETSIVTVNNALSLWNEYAATSGSGIERSAEAQRPLIGDQSATDEDVEQVDGEKDEGQAEGSR